MPTDIRSLLKVKMKYSIMVVDDEASERQGIARLIKKYEYPLKIFTAQNGEEAFRMMSENPVDILLTDIRMPFVDGMELISMVKEAGMTPFCIIYSAYGDFEYAKKAIGLGVVQYLLKPVSLQEFQSVFTHILEACRDRYERQENLAKQTESRQREREGRRLLGCIEKPEYQADQSIQESDFEWPLCPVILSGYENIMAKYGTSYISDFLQTSENTIYYAARSEGQIILFVAAGRQEEVEELCHSIITFTQRDFQSHIFIAAGTLCGSVEKLKKEYGRVVEQLDYQFYVNESMCLFLDNKVIFENGKDMLDLYFQKIETEAQLGNVDAIAGEVEKALLYIERYKGFSSIYIKHRFAMVMTYCCEQFKMESQIITITEKIYMARHLAQLKEVLESFLKECNQYEEPRKDHHIVVKVKQYVEAHYGDYALTVGAIADYLRLSAAYLSSLFKKQTGKNLNRYILEYRLEIARDLLVNTNLRVNEIAEKVGYPNASHFTAIFRSNEGVSPAKFRERVRANV